MDRQSKVSDDKKERSSSRPKSHGPVESQPPSADSGELASEGSHDTVIWETNGSNSSSSSASVSSSGSSDSCMESDDQNHGFKKSPRAEVASLILRGCTHCHMYVMLQKQNPRCPRCDSSDLVSFFHE